MGCSQGRTTACDARLTSPTPCASPPCVPCAPCGPPAEEAEPPIRKVHLRVSDEAKSAELRSNARAGKIRATRIRSGVNVNTMFEISDVVFGYGSYGVVLRAKSVLSNTDVAIKVVPTKDMDEHKFKLLFNEVENCLHVDHPNICRVFEVYEDETSLQIVMEGCFGRTLYDELQECECFTPQRAAATCKQMLEAVQHCHKHKVCHRDLKLDNWVYKDRSPNSPIKLIDFGFSMMCSDGEQMDSVLGTCYYVAPEVIDGPYDTRCDLWSLGIVTYMLLCGVPPYWGRSNSEILQQVRHKDHPLFTEACWKDLPAECVDFVQQLLARDPRQRPTAAEALKHPFLKGVQPDVELVTCDQKVLSSLRSFAQHTPVKRAALSLIAAHLSHRGSTSLEEQFHRLDFEQHGSIDLHEFTQVFARGLGGTEQEAKHVFESLDCLGEHEIHFTEFLAAATEHTLLKEGYLREAFRWFDQDDDGYISRQDLRTVFGDEVQGKGVDEVLDMLDMKHQGKVDTDDWLEFMLRVDAAPKDAGAQSSVTEGSTCLPQSPRSLTQSCPSDCAGPSARPHTCKVVLPTLGDSDSGDCGDCGEDCEV